MECTICFHELTEAAPSTDNEQPGPSRPKKRKNSAEKNMDPKEVVTTLCGHLFHAFCLKKWINDTNGKVCPTCRKPVTVRKMITLYLNGNTNDAPLVPERDLESEYADADIDPTIRQTLIKELKEIKEKNALLEDEKQVDKVTIQSLQHLADENERLSRRINTTIMSLNESNDVRRRVHSNLNTKLGPLITACKPMINKKGATNATAFMKKINAMETIIENCSVGLLPTDQGAGEPFMQSVNHGGKKKTKTANRKRYRDRGFPSSTVTSGLFELGGDTNRFIVRGATNSDTPSHNTITPTLSSTASSSFVGGSAANASNNTSSTSVAQPSLAFGRFGPYNNNATITSSTPAPRTSPFSSIGSALGFGSFRCNNTNSSNNAPTSPTLTFSSIGSAFRFGLSRSNNASSSTSTSISPISNTDSSTRFNTSVHKFRRASDST